MEDKDKEEVMNKEELMTLLTPQGTSHCSCLEHCFLFATAVRLPLHNTKSAKHQSNSATTKTFPL